MYLNNKIYSLKAKLVSIALVLAIIVPLGIKLDHSFQYHTSEDTCKHAKVHFHESSSHNDTLDLFFQPIANHFVDLISNEFNKIVSLNEVTYIVSFFSKTIFYISSRGPPKFIFI